MILEQFIFLLVAYCILYLAGMALIGIWEVHALTEELKRWKPDRDARGRFK